MTRLSAGLLAVLAFMAVVLLAAAPASSAEEGAGVVCGREWITFPASVKQGSATIEGVFTIRRGRVLQINGFPSEGRHVIIVSTPDNRGTSRLSVGAATYMAMVKCMG